FSSFANSFSASVSAWEQASSRCSIKLWESCCRRCRGVFTGFFLADMGRLQASTDAPILDATLAARQPLLAASRRTPGALARLYSLNQRHPLPRVDMPRYRLLLLCLFATYLQAGETDDDPAYSLGVRLGDRLREEVPQLQLPALLEGLRHAYRGEPLKLDPARIEQLLDEHEARLQALPANAEQSMAAEREFLAGER